VFYLSTELLGFKIHLNIKNKCAFRQQNFFASLNIVSSHVISDGLMCVLQLYWSADLTGCILHICRKCTVHIAVGKDAPGKAVFTVVAMEPATVFIGCDMRQHGPLCSQITKGLQFEWEVGWCDSEWSNRWEIAWNCCSVGLSAATVMPAGVNVMCVDRRL
jgi:hypothetical protein